MRRNLARPVKTAQRIPNARFLFGQGLLHGTAGIGKAIQYMQKDRTVRFGDDRAHLHLELSLQLGAQQEAGPQRRHRRNGQSLALQVLDPVIGAVLAHDEGSEGRR